MVWEEWEDVVQKLHGMRQGGIPHVTTLGLAPPAFRKLPCDFMESTTQFTAKWEAKKKPKKLN
jgi:hypothetical protein